MGVKGFQKRLEEAVDEIIGCDIYDTKKCLTNCKTRCTYRIWCIKSAQLGYKEAIETAKEWIKKENSFAVPEWLDENLSEFEKYMNEVKEEQK